MRRLFFISLLWFGPATIFAQDEGCTVLGIQDLSQLYQDLIEAHEELQEAFLGLNTIESMVDNGDGTVTLTLSDESTFDLVLAIAGCTDPAFGEYNAQAMLDDGSCETALQGGCTDPAFAEFDPDAQYDDGSCANAPLASCVEPTMDGHTYSVVQIGSQCWMAENLRTAVYANGESIPFVDGDDVDGWIDQDTDGLYGHYEDEDDFREQFGALYNAFAVVDERGVCPEGWHVPSDAEWKTLELSLGMSAEEVDLESWRGDNQGSDLKSTPSGYPNWDGTNASGFNALAAGRRGWSSGDYQDLFAEGLFWTRTPSSELDAWYYRELNAGESRIKRDFIDGRRGHSIRCLEGLAQELLIEGCMDGEALNFDALANVDSGNCQYVEDENGGDDNGDEDAEPNACQGQDVLTYGGDAYNLAAIGDQCWFAQNLATRFFANGELIPSGMEQGYDEDGPAQEAYNGLDANAALYGRLYNGYAVVDERGLCPSGWRVASEGDWQALEMELGMSSEDAEDDGWRGDEEGHALKSYEEDSPGWDGDNAVGFSAVAAGNWDVDDGFENFGERTYIWTSSLDDSDGWRRRLQSGEGGINKSWQEIWKGYSVRCVRISNPPSATCINPAALNFEEEGECCYDFEDATLLEINADMPEVRFTENSGAWEIRFNWDTREGDITFEEWDLMYSISAEEVDLPDEFGLQFFIGGEDSGLGSFILIEGEGEETPEGYTAPMTLVEVCD